MTETVQLLLSAGRGPQECCWALARLLVRLEADATGRGVTTRRARAVPADGPGTFRSVLIEITGAGAAAFADSWTGTLCWQAPSPYRPRHSRKNWYVVAERCPPDMARTPFAEADVEVVACRTGGPGGQHRNKVSSAVRATHRPSGIVVVVDTERHFGLNRRIALQQLRRRLDDRAERAERAEGRARWQVHDRLVRGNPTRVEKPR
ncbi:peptide chain release factor H [Actinomycetes bacterium KLBMP 9759]